jgi:hypothetical protein
MAKLSQNEELGVVLGSTIMTAITTYATQIPLPAEIKAPTVTLLAAVDGAILTWWRLKVNMPEAEVVKA